MLDHLAAADHADGPEPIWLLKGFNLFEDVPSAIAVADTGPWKRVAYAHGEGVAGGTGTVLLVKEGRVRVRRWRPGTTRVITDVLGPGQLFGFGELPGASDCGVAEAARDSVVLRGRLGDLITVFASSVAAAQDFAASVTARLYKMERQLELIHTQRVPMRVAAALLGLAEENRRQTGIPLILRTQTDIAALVGTTRESVTRVITFLRHEGVLTSRGALRVLDAERLQALAGGEQASRIT